MSLRDLLGGRLLLGRRVDDQHLERDDRRTACFDRGIASDLDLADHLGRAVGTLRDGGRGPGEYRPRCHLRVDRVTLPVVPSISPVAMIDFDDPDGVAANETRQPDTVRWYPYRVRALSDGIVVTSLNQVMVLKEVEKSVYNPAFYFPPGDVEPGRIQREEGFSSRCSIKGDASYWRYVGLDDRAAWRPGDSTTTNSTRWPSNLKLWGRHSVELLFVPTPAGRPLAPSGLGARTSGGRG